MTLKYLRVTIIEIFFCCALTVTHLHAARVIVGIIVDDTIPGYLLFAHVTLLLT